MSEMAIHLRLIDYFERSQLSPHQYSLVNSRNNDCDRVNVILWYLQHHSLEYNSGLIFRCLKGMNFVVKC